VSRTARLLNETLTAALKNHDVFFAILYVKGSVGISLKELRGQMLKCLDVIPSDIRRKLPKIILRAVIRATPMLPQCPALLSLFSVVVLLLTLDKICDDDDDDDDDDESLIKMIRMLCS